MSYKIRSTTLLSHFKQVHVKCVTACGVTFSWLSVWTRKKAPGKVTSFKKYFICFACMFVYVPICVL